MSFNFFLLNEVKKNKKFTEFQILIITIILLISQVKLQATFHFNPTSPPIYPNAILPDGTMAKPFPLYAMGSVFISLLTAGAPVPELNLKFKAGIMNPVAGPPLASMPNTITFSPWGGSSTMITFVGKFPFMASSLKIENCKMTFTPGAQLMLMDPLKSIDIKLTIKDSEFLFMVPFGFYVRMKHPNKIEIDNVKMKRAAPLDIDGYFYFFGPNLSTTEIKINKLEFDGPPPLMFTCKNNLLYFNDKIDCKSLEVKNSKIKIVNLLGFNKSNDQFVLKKNVILKNDFKNGGLLCFQNVSKSRITVSDITIKGCKINSSRLIQVCSSTAFFLTEKINLIDLVFDAGMGPGNQILPRFILTLDQIGEMYVNNLSFSNVKSKYDDNKAPNILIHTKKPIINLTIFDVDIPDNYEVGSFISTYGKITYLNVDMVKSYFSSGYFKKFEGDAKGGGKKRRNNLISIFSGVQNAVFSNIAIKKNVVSKSPFILVFNGIDLVKFEGIKAEENLVGSQENAKVSLISVLQTKDKLNAVEIRNSKFIKNYSINPKKNKNYSACFTFNGKINNADVQNTQFLFNRAHDENYDNFDITALKTNLEMMNIYSSTDDELKKKYSGISGNGGGFQIFGKRINIIKTTVMCTAKSPNLKGKIRSYDLEKDGEELEFDKVEDFYKFKC
jgi:hypothetical protein